MVAINMKKKCVHTEHCCRIHGCKYGDDDCPVWLGYKSQSYPCESCGTYYYSSSDDDEYIIPDLKDVPKVRYSEFLERRAKLDDFNDDSWLHNH